MHWAIWDRLEDLLLEAEVSPVIAVVPDNADPKLMIDAPSERFWDRVRAWQARGWAIGLHGYRHSYVNDQSGIVGFRGGSEFAGLPIDEQDSKLERALGVFALERVRADAWIAPNHSFDRTTLSLLRRRGLSVVSDGFSLLPYRDTDGMTWVPQQLWGLRTRPFGVWTVCLHPNRWDPDQLDSFARDLRAYSGRMTSLAAVVTDYRTRRRTLVDDAFDAWARRGRQRPAGSMTSTASPE
jgi:hypothetical protein